MNSDQIPEENNATPAPSVKIQCPNCHADIFGVGSSFGIKTPPPSEGEKSLGQLWCDSAFEKAKELLPHVPYNSWEKLSPYEKDIAEHASQAVISAAVEREKKLAELNEMIVLKQARQILDLRKQLAQANERAEKAEKDAKRLYDALIACSDSMAHTELAGGNSCAKASEALTSHNDSTQEKR